MGRRVLAVAAGGAHVKRSYIEDWFKRNSEWLRKSSRDISARLVAVFVNMQIIVLIQSNHTELGGKPTPSVGVNLTCFVLFTRPRQKLTLTLFIFVFSALSTVRGIIPDPQLGSHPNDASGLHGRQQLEPLR